MRQSSILKRPAGLRLLGAVLAGILVAGPAAAALGFGTANSAHPEAKAEGWTPQYGQFWVTRYTKNYWHYVDQQLSDARARGVTPVIEWYYWGDAITPNCVKYGCSGMSKGEWWWMGETLAKKVRAKMGDKTAIIVVETEFNKGGIERSEEFDGTLAAHMRMLKQHAPNAKLALGFGNWNSGEWWRFDQSMREAHYAGLQLMRGLTKDSWNHYKSGPDSLVSGAQKLKSTFGKPIIVHDIALASHNALTLQNDVIKGLRDRRGTLEGAGVFALVYREVRDYKDACTCWYYGAAERTFGLKYADGKAKPAWWTWRDMAKSNSAPPAPSGSGAFDATFTPMNGNTWWVQTSVKANEPVSKVEVRLNGGGWTTLNSYSWGWAKSLHSPVGTSVQFRATSSSGAVDYSGTYSWLK